MQFVYAPCVIAWSVHAVDDTLRRRLVPTTRYTMYELRQGLIDTLLLRPLNYLRTTMIEVVLIDHVNDSIQHAEDMAMFVRGIVDAVPGCKLMVNLIPYNEINSNDGSNNFNISSKSQSFVYRKPNMERVMQYQQHLWSRGVYAPVRVTRGDDESAACGQLVTSLASKKKRSIITT
jgi:23S rRNA (adenine2503-C2)-methyltransferase